ncbi:MAG TPA: amidohydrolase family protein [Opitutaceae bacterium]|nr:amidohydrolase family protein [Opitutaceae bacterium]
MISASSDPRLEPVLAAAARKPVWLRVGRLFDGRHVVRDAHLVFEGARIRHAGADSPSTTMSLAQSAPDLELPGYTALPGLIDAHVHLFLEGGEEKPERRARYLKLDDAELLDRAHGRLERLLRIGITAVRDAGDRNGVGLALQRRYRSAARGAMPYLDSPGAALHHRGRYGAFMGRAIEEDATIEAAVAARSAEGVHRIKLLATGIINFEQGAVTAKPQLDADELARAVAAARAHRRQTMVHCSGADGVENCLAARVDTIEHGFFVTDEQLARLRDLDVAWVPTFAPVRFQLDQADALGWSEPVRDNLRRILDGHVRSLARAAALGVRIIAGSDAGSHGVPHGHGFLRELELMAEAGLGPEQILRAATAASADRLGFAEEIGSLRPGAAARFLLSPAPVLDDVRHLRNPLVTVFDGRVFAGGDDAAVPGL